MGRLLVIARLTLQEAVRRMIVPAMLVFGLAFLLLFAAGLGLAMEDVQGDERIPEQQRRLLPYVFVMAGLYAVNFLMIMTAVLTPVDSVAGEIGSGVMQTVAARPVRRSEILLGKWLAFGLIVTGYLALMGGGVVGIGWLAGGVVPPGLAIGLPLMLLEGLLLMTLSVAVGTRLGAIATGVAVFGLFGLAFIGGWVEQLGARVGNEGALYAGTVASLIMPSESLWQLAAWHMQPAVMRELELTPFSLASVPSRAMVAWAAVYTAAALAAGVAGLRRRAL